MEPQEEISFQHEFVVQDDTAVRMARTVVATAFRRKQAKWTVLGLLAVQMVIYSFGYRDQRLGVVLLSSLFWAAVVTLGLMLLVAGLSYRNNRRVLRRGVRPGEVMRTGFGKDEFVTANALSSSRFTYDAVDEVISHRDFVLIRYTGHHVPRIYPQSLFPPEAMSRIQALKEREDPRSIGQG